MEIKNLVYKNLAEIILSIFLVAIGYIYEGFDGILLGGGLAILLIFRAKMRKKIKW